MKICMTQFHEPSGCCKIYDERVACIFYCTKKKLTEIAYMWMIWIFPADSMEKVVGIYRFLVSIKMRWGGGGKPTIRTDDILSKAFQ